MRNIAIVICALLLLTSCYTYKQTADITQLQEGDRIRISYDDGPKTRKKRIEISEITDSHIVGDDENGYYRSYEIESISSIQVGELSMVKTVAWIVLPTLVVAGGIYGLGLALVFGAL